MSRTLGAYEKMFYDGNYVKNFTACLRRCGTFAAATGSRRHGARQPDCAWRTMPAPAWAGKAPWRPAPQAWSGSACVGRAPGPGLAADMPLCALRGAGMRPCQAMMSSMHGSRGIGGTTLNRPWWAVITCMRHPGFGAADVRQPVERSVFASATLRF